MRRLRFAASLTSGLDMEFGEAAKARRRRHFERSAQDPTLGMHGIAVMAAFGYRAETPHRDKSRKPLSESVEWVK